MEAESSSFLLLSPTACVVLSFTVPGAMNSLVGARDEFGVDLAQSYMIGDKLIDLECGWNAGVRKCLLVRTGYGAELERVWADKCGVAAVVDNLSAAAQWIIEHM